MVRIVKNAKGNLNVWADYDTREQVYCDTAETAYLFILKGEMYAKKYPERALTPAHLDDFMATLARLDDFHFDFTDDGIVYYKSKK